MGNLLHLVSNLGVTRAAYRAAAGVLFHRYFNVVAAASDDLRSEVFRIRYDVYCDELRFEDPAAFPNRQEADDYDAYALHALLRHKSQDAYAGCVRLVLVNPDDTDSLLPFERLCQKSLYADRIRELVPNRLKVGEISRLAVRSNFRRRKGEDKVPGGIVEERSGKLQGTRRPWIALGLYLSAAAIGLIKGLDGVFALMEPRLARRLGTYGIKFVQVGDPVEHRGLRAPFFISRDSLFKGLPSTVRGLLDVVESDLRETGAETMTIRGGSTDTR